MLTCSTGLVAPMRPPLPGRGQSRPPTTRRCATRCAAGWLTATNEANVVPSTRCCPAVVAVSDILSFGRDREPRWRWRRWQLAAAAVGIAVALATVFIWYRPGLRQHDAQTRPSALGPS